MALATPAFADEAAFTLGPFERTQIGGMPFHRAPIEATGAGDWPFLVERGFVTCAILHGRVTAYFEEALPEGVSGKARATVLDHTPFVSMVPLNDAGNVVRRTPDLAADYAALSPIVTAARRPCVEEKG